MDTLEEKLDKLEVLLKQSSVNMYAVALIAALLSIPTGTRYGLREMTPQEQKEKTLQALVSVFEGLKARRCRIGYGKTSHRRKRKSDKPTGGPQHSPRPVGSDRMALRLTSNAMPCRRSEQVDV